jgi:predicted nuclease of predicted toxin-antitoxin system
MDEDSRGREHPRVTVDRLRAHGHDVRDIRGSGKQGIADAELWYIAISEGRLLITTDKGFAEYRATRHNGILIVRLRQPNRIKIQHSVMAALERFGETISSRSLRYTAR